MLHHRPDPVVRIRTPDWCRRQLGTVSSGLLHVRDRPATDHGVLVECVAEGTDLVFVVVEQTELTWSLVWGDVLIEVSATPADVHRWVVRATGTCERQPVPAWAAELAARSSHPAYGRAGQTPRALLGLRLRDVDLRGYSVRRTPEG